MAVMPVLLSSKDTAGCLNFELQVAVIQTLLF